MATFHERIKQIRIDHDLTLDGFASLFGTHRPTIWRYEKGERRPTINFVKAVADYFNVSIDWLAGTSDIKEREINSTELSRVFNGLSDNGKREVFRFVKYIQGTDQTTKTKENHKVNIIGQTAAGVPIEHHDWLEEPVDNPPNHADFALIVKGDSMEPDIKNGSTVWVHKQPDVENGEIAIIEIDGSVTCKKIYKTDGHLELQSINTSYKPLILDKGNVRIIGKVIL